MSPKKTRSAMWDFSTGFASGKKKRKRQINCGTLLRSQLEFPISASKIWTDTRR
jgi:hypothetical protein